MSRAFLKADRMENLSYEVRGAVVEEAARMEAAGTPVIKLNIGNPAAFGFQTPDYIKQALIDGITVSQGYSTSPGLPSAREAIYEYVLQKGLHNVSTDRIYTGNGVSELILIAMETLLNDGDEILIPSPDYPLWTAAATLAGGKVVHYVCDEQAGWLPDIEDMRRKITAKTKALVIINPNNPTGVVYPKEILEKIIDLAREHQLIMLSDEIYDRLLLDGLTHTSVAALAPDVPVITMNGLSKSHLAAGFRCGWMTISGDISSIKNYIEGLDMFTSMRLCSNVLAQSVIPVALQPQNQIPENLLKPGGRIHDQRDVVYSMLNAIPGVSVVKPQAAFYAFPKIDTARFNITDDQQFAYDLLRSKHVLIVQGSGFNWKAPDHFRIVTLADVDTLKTSITKIGDFLTD